VVDSERPPLLSVVHDRYRGGNQKTRNQKPEIRSEADASSNRTFVIHELDSPSGPAESPGFWFLVSGFWFLVSGFWFLVSGFWFLVSGFWFLLFSDF
jgi:hypothetical protein